MTPEEEQAIINAVQAELDVQDNIEIDLFPIIEDTELTEEQKEWAHENLGVVLTIDRGL